MRTLVLTVLLFWIGYSLAELSAHARGIRYSISNQTYQFLEGVETMLEDSPE